MSWKNRMMLSLLVVVLSSISLAEPSALVLSGGGAKGAYQVGVWKAMAEFGIVKDIKAISGTSVGGINAALFASVRDCRRIESVWLDSMGSVMVVDKDKVCDALQEGVDDFGKSIDSRNAFVESEKLKEAQRLGVDAKSLPVEVATQIEKKANQRLLLSTTVKIIGRMVAAKGKVSEEAGSVEGYVDPDKLRELIEGNLPQEWSADAPKVYVTAVEKGSWKRTEYCLNDEPFSRKVKMLQATSAIPVLFSTAEIDGKSYYDGGWTGKGGDNVPGDPILNHHPEISTVYVVYLNEEKRIEKDRDRENAEQYKGKRLVEIIPSRSLLGSFGALNFSAEKARELIQLGYDDAKKILSKGRCH